MIETVRVGMAEYKAARSPVVLISLGLGSCVGVALYDSAKKIGGLAHIMLPDSNLSGRRDFNPGKFADTAIDMLIGDMDKIGADPKRITAKIAGGAQMFQIKSDNSIMQIGKRNVEAVRSKLATLNVKIISEDVEGNYGRTIEFNCETGELKIKTVGHGLKII
ncbi:MAG: chemotaxis protein CheD [Tepidanaerobacteraceae bacterium]|nr:chemotaxis protein CheD [Tepidanaerobacteraceae bacterium]